MRSAPLSPADLGDRHRRFVALAMLALGAFYALSALGSLLDPGTAAVANALELVLVLLAVGFAMPIVVRKFRFRGSDEWHFYVGRDGFVADTIARAHIASWVVTFFVLLAFAFFGERFPEVPTKRLLEGVVALMLIVFALVFLFLERTPDEEGGEESASA